MIVIDGQNTGLTVSNYENLEDLLVKMMESENLESRVVTDVLVDDEAFSEIYPHQAEDIETSSIQKVEIKSVSVTDMAVSITTELETVVQIMSQGGRKVAELFRQADDAEALELFQDLLDVTQNFMRMIAVLREEFDMSKSTEFNAASQEISGVLTEISEVLENEDWILLADLLEFEFIPSVEKWDRVISLLRQDISE
ncbi:hypothetical protein [Oceanidesulfovibrio marinus]|uniref:Uncharacterized protein n=1 Tax=Oceanidesulfovibrio marinus TaxID=370038 RepID=A0A6P1ZNF8_9BACT|nr:hypothetical protein [Oceanidesulfovibrio marinus]QJT09958.1 hypothetical protein E8L03_13905 [Oceanidesulfovibrio marinus]TVM35925.1 hypothetical protein DQK91_04530 [Oceanidesulfovibrio marinus]